MKSKKIVIPALVLGGLMLIGLLWTGRAAAQAVVTNQPLVDKLVERFNLGKDEVAGVFDEIQQEHQQQRRAMMNSRLDEAVNDGVITADQKQAFLDKQVEMEERHRQEREEMRQWMEESGIDFEKLAPYRVGDGPGFGGRDFGRGHWGGF
jgi:polyhydroxyalkanoate synthesis regulator phasin